MAWLYLALFFLTLFLWGVRQTCRDKSRPPDPRIPGPKPAFLLGNMTLLKNCDISSLFQELFARYGPIYKLKIWKEHWVVVSDYAMLREMFVTKGMTFAGRSSSFPMDFFSSHLGILFSMDLDKEVQQLRNILTKSVKKITHGPSSNDKSTDYKNEALEDFIQNLASTNGKPHECRNDVKRLVSMMTAEMIFGEVFCVEHQQLDDLGDLLKAVFTSKDKLLVDMLPLIKMFNPPSWRNCQKIHRLIESMYSAYKQKIAKPRENTDDETMMHYLTEATEVKTGHSDDKVVRGLMASIIIAAMPSTSSFIYMTLLTIACIPRIQRKVHQELEEFVGDRAPRLSDRENCHYIQATILEVLRNLFTSVAEAPRKALKDTTLGGYDIPAGTIIYANTWSIHHDPEFWDKPYEYKPERFLDAAGRLLPADHPTRQKFMPFNAGPRVCPGEAFAKARLFIVISSLFRKFTIRPQDGADMSCLDPRRVGTMTSPRIKLRFMENI